MSSAISNAYFRRIEAGKITLEDVLANKNIQDHVKEEVKTLVEEAEKAKIPPIEIPEELDSGFNVVPEFPDIQVSGDLDTEFLGSDENSEEDTSE